MVMHASLPMSDEKGWPLASYEGPGRQFMSRRPQPLRGLVPAAARKILLRVPLDGANFSPLGFLRRLCALFHDRFLVSVNGLAYNLKIPSKNSTPTATIQDLVRTLP